MFFFFLIKDAASLAVAIMKKKAGGRIFLGCDNHPLSRQEVMDLMAESGKYDKKFKGFTSEFLSVIDTCWFVLKEPQASFRD